MNEAFTIVRVKNGGNPPFFEFGTADATRSASPEMVQETEKREFEMTANLNNALAGFAALTLSLLTMATAILPASPAGLLA